MCIHKPYLQDKTFLIHKSWNSGNHRVTNIYYLAQTHQKGQEQRQIHSESITFSLFQSTYFIFLYIILYNLSEGTCFYVQEFRARFAFLHFTSESISVTKAAASCPQVLSEKHQQTGEMVQLMSGFSKSLHTRRFGNCGLRHTHVPDVAALLLFGVWWEAAARTHGTPCILTGKWPGLPGRWGIPDSRTHARGTCSGTWAGGSVSNRETFRHIL